MYTAVSLDHLRFNNHKKKKNNKKKNKAWAEAAASSRISISVLPVVSGIQDKTASMIKKINSRFTHKYILIADNASTSKALVHTLYTLKTRLLLSAVRKCHVFLTVACKHQKQQQSDFNVSTNINAVYFSTLNWAAKVHELLTNLAVHGCRVSLLIMFRWRDYWCYVTGRLTNNGVGQMCGLLAVCCHALTQLGRDSVCSNAVKTDQVTLR